MNIINSFDRISAHSSFQIFLILTQLNCLYGIVTTQSPSTACVGENITVSCVLNVPKSGDMFVSTRTDFILGISDDSLSESLVDGSNTLNGIDLSRFMADAPFGNLTSVTGSITLLSYKTSDENFRMGCRIDFRVGGAGAAVPLIEAPRLKQATPPSSPSLSTSLSTLSASKCQGVSVSWLAPATDRAITQYYLYRNSSLISTLSSTTTQYTDTDPLTLNAAYLYSLAAASCAGNSTSPTILISVPDGNFRIRLNVSENSLIEPGLTPFNTSVPLLFNFSLYNNTDEIETLSNIAYSDLNSQSFMAEFIFDVCYRMTASVLTCSDQIKEVSSKHFILPGVRNGGGSFQNISTLSSHRIAWIYKFDNPRCNDSDLEEYYFISKNYFEFSLYRNETQESVPITEFDLNFPLNFTFTIPPSFDISNETILLRILFNGEYLNKDDIVFLMPGPPTIIVDIGILPTSTIILISVFLFLTILLITATFLAVVFCIIYKKKIRII